MRHRRILCALEMSTSPATISAFTFASRDPNCRAGGKSQRPYVRLLSHGKHLHEQVNYTTDNKSFNGDYGDTLPIGTINAALVRFTHGAYRPHHRS